jgi:hypothetical protein
MVDERKSGQQQRATLRMLRPSFERAYPAAQDTATDEELLALLKKADRRRIIADSRDKHR